MAARLGKSVQNWHRIVGFLYIVELAHSFGIKYLEKYSSFPNNGEVTTDFIDDMQYIYAEYLINHNVGEIQHHITLDIVERCRDLITGNIEQYKLLMYLAPEDRLTEEGSSSSSLTSLKNEPANEPISKKQKRIIRLQPRMTEIMSRILLYRSLIFTSTNLYIDRVIKRSASILGLALTNLIEYGLIHAVKKGLLSSKWTTVYVKILPDPYSTDDQMKFEFKLSELGISSLNLESLRDTCHELLIEGKGNVSEELIQFLQKPEYRELSLDMTTLIQRYNNCQPIDNEDVNFSHEPASATTIESTSVTHDSSCDTDTVWNAGNHLLAKMCEREEHADSNLNIVPDEMTTNAFQGW
ncbi:unnamed protein product [Rotaria magnacalcarata]|uniref:Uncharacterized protein n=2 Tax=Rotaria magnacalcarata TaxID=392030 RepID=A0A816PYV5_9BILA|nr:unnamed protein product [Rotaria magnacalcarata]